MQEAISRITMCGGSPRNPSIELIDLTTHPDAELLGLCTSLAKLRDAQERLEDAIARTEFEIRRTPSRTVDGARMKGLAI
jgi:hypothetical protein